MILLIIFSGAILSIFLLLSFPIIRNYPFYGEGDIHSHLGIIFNIIQTGNFDSMNPYPVVHILISVLSTLTLITPEKISMFIPQIFFTLYILSLYILSKSFNFERVTNIIIASLGLIPIFGWWITINYIFNSNDAFFLFPLILYIFIQSRLSNKKQIYTILLTPMLLLIPFFHPEIIIFFFPFMILFFFASFISQKYRDHCMDSILQIKIFNSWIPILIFFLGIWIWILSYISIGNTIYELLNMIIYGLTGEITPPLTNVMGGFKRELPDVIQTLFFSYGATMIFLLVGFILVGYIIFKFFIKKREIDFLEIFFAILFLVYITINIIFLFRGGIIGFSIFRQTKYPLFICTILIGYFYSNQIKKSTKIKYSSIILILIVIFSLLIGIFNFYPSPTIHSINAQPTISNIKGMEFFYENRDTDLLITEGGVRAFQNRYADYLRIETRKNIRSGYLPDTQSIPHFGYNESRNLGNFFNRSTYLILYPPARDYYSIVNPKYKEYWRYSPAEYDLLKYDNSNMYFYDNGEIQLLKISPLKKIA